MVEPPKPLRNSKISTAAEAFKDFLDLYNIQDKFDETRVVSSWAKLMGQPIAKRTQKIYIKDGRLFVKLSSAPLKHELNLSKSKILDLINGKFPKGIVEDIIFL